MLKVIDLLRLPSLSEAFIAAGAEGMFKIIRKLEVLEEAYPSVVRFLRPNEFYLTNFWSLVDKKEGRIKLIEEMIEHHCSGIGIMPGEHLDDKIDEEILALANEREFPIIYIPSSVRWGNLISEYGIVASGSTGDLSFASLKEILNIFNAFHTGQNVSRLCRDLSQMLNLPLIIGDGAVYSHNTEKISVPMVVSRVHQICGTVSEVSSLPMTVRIDNQWMAIAYPGRKSMLVACVENTEIRERELQLLNQIAPMIVHELDRITHREVTNRPLLNLRSLKNTKTYLVLLKGKNYAHFRKNLGPECLVYDQDSFLQTMIILIRELDTEKESLYSVLHNICSKAEPELFVFSQICYDQANVASEISQLKYLVNSLSYLKGMYCLDELPLLYMLEHAPEEYDTRIFATLRLNEGLPEEAETFMTTLRLYVVLQSLSDVAAFLGIHVNSVKYRLNKALSYLGMDNSVSLSSLPYVKLLMILEHLVTEYS